MSNKIPSTGQQTDGIEVTEEMKDALDKVIRVELNDFFDPYLTGIKLQRTDEDRIVSGILRRFESYLTGGQDTQPNGQI